MLRTLTDADIARLLPAGRQYRSTAIVHATRVAEDSEWTSPGGEVLHADAGDWWVSDGGADRWSVASPIFSATYEHLAGDEYRKTAPVTAVQIDEPFTVQTLEGDASGEAGDWLVCNPSGECWPVPAAVFARRYMPA